MTTTVTPFTHEIAASPDPLAMPEGAHQASLYEAAQSIRSYKLNVIPGFLQVPGYAEAIQRTWARLLYPEAEGTPHAASDGAISSLDALTIKGVSRVLSLGSAALTEGKSADVVLEAAALRSGFGDGDVMRAQMAKLATVSELLPGVRIRVIPEGVRTGIAASSGFEIIDHTDVYIEVAHAELHVTGQEDVAYFERLFSLLAAQAVPFSQYARDQL